MTGDITKAPLEITLDGVPVELSVAGRPSWAQIVASLRRLAHSRDRVVSALFVDGVIQTDKDKLAPGTALQSVTAVTVSCRELSRESLRIAREQVWRLSGRLETVELLILINDWAMAKQLWGELAPDFKAPLLELNFLCELGGERMLPTDEAGSSRSGMAEALGRIQAEMELRLQGDGDVVELVTALEQRLGPWLADLDRLLERTYEAYSD